MKFIFNQLLFLLALMMIISCSHSSIMQNSKVELSTPDNVITLARDATFQSAFSEVMNAYDVLIVNDTVIVFQDQISSSNNHHFKAYSLNTFDYLGAIVPNGKALGEMVRPRIMKGLSDSKNLRLISSTQKIYLLNVLETLRSAKTTISQSLTLPAETIGCILLPDLNQFVFQLDKGKPVCQTFGNDGLLKKTYNYADEFKDESSVTYLSGFFVGRNKTGDVAQITCFFPQINLFSAEKGSVKTIAVDNAYNDWKSVVGKMISKDTRQYYVSATSSQDYIIAAYKCVTLEEIMRGNSKTSFHIFDWNGNFLYEINVAENIGKIVLDAKAGYLYCLEQQEGRLIRYDLNPILDMGR